MKTIGLLILASSLFAVPAQADGWRCVDAQCTGIVNEVSPGFVALTVDQQVGLYTTFCVRVSKLRALHHVVLQTCTFRYQGKNIIRSNGLPILAEPLFDPAYLLSLELRDSP